MVLIFAAIIYDGQRRMCPVMARTEGYILFDLIVIWDRRVSVTTEISKNPGIGRRHCQTSNRVLSIILEWLGSSSNPPWPVSSSPMSPLCKHRTVAYLIRPLDAPTLTRPEQIAKLRHISSRSYLRHLRTAAFWPME